MRTTSPSIANVLFPVARQRVLAEMLSDPGRELHLREITRRVGLAPATVQREVTSLAAAGILHRRPSGRQVYYRADPACPVFPELRGLVNKTVGLSTRVRQALEPLASRIRLALVFGSMAAGTETSGSDVDLLLVGDVGLRDLGGALRAMREATGREVNAVTMSVEEFANRRALGDHFLDSVLDRPVIPVIGEPHDPAGPADG